MKPGKLLKDVTMSPGSNFGKKFQESIGKKSVADSEVDGLINWAKDLPDDISVQAGQSFYQNMLNRTINKEKPQ